jgi:hypothetical protein
MNLGSSNGKLGIRTIDESVRGTVANSYSSMSISD